MQPHLVLCAVGVATPRALFPSLAAALASEGTRLGASDAPRAANRVRTQAGARAPARLHNLAGTTRAGRLAEASHV